MAARKYSEYKDCGVDWLGDLPEKWSVTRIKHAGSVEMGQSPSSDMYSDNVDFTPFLQGNADFGEMFPVPRHYCDVSTKFAEPSDVLFSVRAPVGAINIADQRYGIGRGLCAIQGSLTWHDRFAYYSMYVAKPYLHSIATGSTYEAVTADEVADCFVPLPPMKEQISIATFLDRETSKIDALVSEQRRLIELLKEKRQAVISHAVTKGLNPNAPMKPSNIPWLGDVPEHWEVVPTKRFFRLVADPAPNDNDMELLSIYTAIGVRPRKSLEAKGNKATTTDGYWIVKKGDLIVNKLLAWMGAIGVSEYEGVTSPAYDILRQSRPLNSKFYHYLFRCGICFTEFRRFSYGIMDMRLRLYFDQFGLLPMPFPPKDEQDEIVEWLDEELGKLERLIDKAEEAISLLQERRTALISAAVTGKIDVRNAVPEPASA